MTNNLISIIIPVYNGERYLAAAITSVLAQTYTRFEVIVVDDGSSDGSGDVVRAFGSAVRYERQRHSGSPDATRNHGVKVARGDHLAFLDQDDLWLKNKLELQAQQCAADGRLDLVFGLVEQFLSPDLPPDAAEQMHYPTGVAAGCILSAMLVRRSAFFRVGWFPTRWKLSGFVDWYARARELGLNEVMLPETIARRRIHCANLNLVQPQARLDYVRAIKASLDRRRGRETL